MHIYAYAHTYIYMQLAAVQGGVVGWVVEHLYAHADTMSEQSAEHTTALLVNLAQHAAGRHACAALKDRLVPLLAGVKGCENIHVYVYSVSIVKGCESLCV